MDDEQQKAELAYRAWLAGFLSGAEKALGCALAGMATGRGVEQICGEVVEAHQMLVFAMSLQSAAGIEQARRID